MSLLQNSNAISEGGYSIANSLRFQSASSQSLSRTYSTTRTSGQILTYSAWIKRGILSSSAEYSLFGAYDGSLSSSRISFKNDSLAVVFGGSTNNDIVTTAVYRDVSAWYHIVVAIDTTQATNTNRIKVYVNGIQVTSFGTTNYPAQNSNSQFLYTGANNRIGVYGDNSGGYFDGYISELNVIDGQALTPSLFGETNTLTGQWVAKKYTGTYGTNGFYLPFSNGTSTTTLGYDSSGNSNNWTLNNFTRSAGVSDCWMNDVPSGNGSSVGGTQPNSNYAVLNPLGTGGGNLTNANLNFANSTTSTNQTRYSTVSIPTSGGLIYFEVKVNSASGSFAGGIGVTNSVRIDGTPPADSSTGWGLQFDGSNVYKRTNSSNTTLYSGITSTNTYMVAVNTTTGNIWFGRDGVWAGSGDPAAGTNAAFTGLTGELTCYVFGYILAGASWSLSANFGQRPFAYTPPSGFKALCTANLPASTIVKGNQFMDATTYSGQGTNLTLVNAGGFQPDIVWMKCRSNADDHALVDSVRGVTPALYPNSTTAEISAGYLTSFNSNGVTITTGFGTTNIAGRTYVAWQWDAGSSTVTNTNGTISSQVRANPTAGVSVVTYTGTGANATVGHGLGVAPKMVIVKRRDNGIGATNWWVYHAGVNNGVNPQQYNLKLNLTNAQAGLTAAWNDTAPTSSVFTVGTSTEINGSGGTFVAYTFAEIAGFSKFGSYTGNASSDGNFLYFGFRPKYIMIKNITTNGFGGWVILDSSRNSFNVVNSGLAAESAGAEFTVAYGDFLSNGFKIRIVDNGVNASGQSYIYMAFAENPFANANAR